MNTHSLEQLSPEEIKAQIAFSSGEISKHKLARLYHEGNPTTEARQKLAEAEAYITLHATFNRHYLAELDRRGLSIPDLSPALIPHPMAAHGPC